MAPPPPRQVPQRRWDASLLQRPRLQAGQFDQVGGVEARGEDGPAPDPLPADVVLRRQARPRQRDAPTRARPGVLGLQVGQGEGGGQARRIGRAAGQGQGVRQAARAVHRFHEGRRRQPHLRQRRRVGQVGLGARGGPVGAGLQRHAVRGGWTRQGPGQQVGRLGGAQGHSAVPLVGEPVGQGLGHAAQLLRGEASPAGPVGVGGHDLLGAADADVRPARGGVDEGLQRGEAPLALLGRDGIGDAVGRRALHPRGDRVDAPAEVEAVPPLVRVQLVGVPPALGHPAPAGGQGGHDAPQIRGGLGGALPRRPVTAPPHAEVAQAQDVQHPAVKEGLLGAADVPRLVQVQRDAPAAQDRVCLRRPGRPGLAVANHGSARERGAQRLQARGLGAVEALLPSLPAGARAVLGDGRVEAVPVRVEAQVLAADRPQRLPRRRRVAARGVARGRPPQHARLLADQLPGGAQGAAGEDPRQAGQADRLIGRGVVLGVEPEGEADLGHGDAPPWVGRGRAGAVRASGAWRAAAPRPRATPAPGMPAPFPPVGGVPCRSEGGRPRPHRSRGGGRRGGGGRPGRAVWMRGRGGGRWGETVPGWAAVPQGGGQAGLPPACPPDPLGRLGQPRVASGGPGSGSGSGPSGRRRAPARARPPSVPARAARPGAGLRAGVA